MLMIWLVVLGQGFYFENATVYDETSRSMRPNQHVLIDESGRVAARSDTPLEPLLGETVVPDVLIMPHFSDFYSLTQERGLGIDEDLDMVNQIMLMNSYRRGGIFLVRDPMFPADGIDESYTQGVGIHAQKGYVDLAQGPASAFGIVADPEQPVAALLEALPATGPVTLWWSSMGGEPALHWEPHVEYLKQLRTALHQQQRKLGVYVQDAVPADIRLLEKLVIDFVEGIPVDASGSWRSFGDAVWIPMAALNDKRYCAKNLDDRMIDATNRGLYGRKQAGDVRARLRGIHVAMKDRCDVWEKRRRETLSVIAAWLSAGGKLGIGSAGGHPFAFSGGIRMEFSVLAEFGASEADLFMAAFETTPALIGAHPPYLTISRPAHFIAYINDAQQPWHEFVGKRVDFNFTDGVQVVKPR